jgi:sugar O-acyltransferase (sialic acid O-acetyltransferase NeuD family)
MKKLILIGGGGHCKSAIDVVETENKYTIAGILDINYRPGMQVCDYPVIGTDEAIVSLVKEDYEFIITLGQIKTAELRMKIFNHLKSLNAKIATVISPNAFLSRHSKIGEGTIVMHQAIINSGAAIGHNCIINTRALVEHDATIADHCHISTSGIINGSCKIGTGSFIGSGAIIINNKTIADRSIVGAGTVVTEDVSESDRTIVGNPGRIL